MAGSHNIDAVVVAGGAMQADWVLTVMLFVAMLLLSAWGILDNLKQQTKDKVSEQRQ
jgi:hypothetical protein